MSNTESTITINCTDCNATGVIKENKDDRHAFYCSKCNGSEKIDFWYTPFTTKKEETGIQRIFDGNFNYEHSHKKYERINFHKYGCSYEDWLHNEAKLIPVKELYCPALYLSTKQCYNNNFYILKIATIVQISLGTIQLPCSHCLNGLINDNHQAIEIPKHINLDTIRTKNGYKLHKYIFEDTHYVIISEENCRYEFFNYFTNCRFYNDKSNCWKKIFK